MTRCLIPLAMLVSLGSLNATTLIYKDFDALVKESGGIVSGVVSTVNSYYDENRELRTFVTLDRIEALDGRLSIAARDRFVFRVPGGQTERETVDIHGSPHFLVGETVVLFLHPDHRQFVPITGWTQGVFRLVLNPTNGKYAVTDYEGNVVLGVQDGELQKAVRNQPEAQIVDLRTGAVKSRPAEVSSGRSQFGATTQVAGAAENRGFADAMTAAEFVAAIRRRAAGKAGQAVVETMTAEERRLAELGSRGVTSGQPDVPSPDGSDSGSGAVETDPFPPKHTPEGSAPDPQ